MNDFHTHFVTQDVLDWLKENNQTVNAKWIKKSPDKAEFLSVNDKWAFELKEEFVNPDLYVNQMEKVGVTHAIISPIPQLFLYDFTSEITSEVSNIYNQSLANWSKSNPAKISALGTVTLNNPETAAEDLRKAMAAGLKGAIIGPGLNGQLLSNEVFTPFWEEANRLKAIIFIHPLLCEDPRLNQRMMPNLIGVPWETTICAADILLSGMLDKFPNVKILLAHGGGLLPYQIGRLNKGYQQWPVVSNTLTKEPSEYLKHFWYDSVLWNDQALEYLANTVGEDRIVPGSDFPFDLCAWPPSTTKASGSDSLLK